MRRLRNWVFPVRDSTSTLTCREAFDMFDADGNGWLSEDELRAVISRQGGGAPLSDAEFEVIFVEFDLNHDGQITFNEFSRMWGTDDAVVPAGRAAQRPAAAAAQVAVGLGVKRPPPMAPLSKLAPIQTMLLAEQTRELTTLTGGRTNSLRAVLTNLQPESLRAKVDELVETHLGQRLRYLAGERTEARGAAALARSVAPATMLHEPAESEGVGGYYNGTLLLLFYPDVPDGASTNCETLMAKLLELRTPDKGKPLHHILAVPCGLTGETFGEYLNAPRERSKPGLRKYWRTAGIPGSQNMYDHKHVGRLLKPLIAGVQASNQAMGGPAVSIS